MVSFRLAEAELLEEARKGAIRSELIGPEGWKKNVIPKPNKLFLNKTLQGAMYMNRHSHKKKEKSENIDKV